MKLWAFTAALIAVLVFGSMIGSAQDAKPVVAGALWRVDFAYETPRVIEVAFGERTRTYWYQLYTVTNDTRNDIINLLLDIRATTDTNREYTQIPDPEAERAIIIREAELQDENDIDAAIAELKSQNKFINMNEINPKRESDSDRTPALKVGESKHCIAIFSDIDRNMDRLIIHYGGLASLTKIEKGNAVPNIQSLRLYYEMAGDEYDDWRDRVKFVKQNWVQLDPDVGFNQTRSDISGNREAWTDDE